MNLSPSGVFLNGDLDSVCAILEEQVSTYLKSDETSSCFFDILSSGPAGSSFHSSILEDIDLSLQCEDDDIDYINTANLQDNAKQTSQMTGGFNSLGTAALSSSQGLHVERHFMSPMCLIENTSPVGTSQPSSGMAFQISFPAQHTGKSKPPAQQNLKDQTVTICQLCSIQFSSKEALCVHNKDKHDIKNENLEYRCTVCQVNFGSKKALISHVKTHTVPQSQGDKACKDSSDSCVYSCKSCKFTCETKMLLNNHIKTKHDLQRKVFTCEECKFSCLQERTLMLHFQRHGGEPKFACDQCGKLFLTMSILKRHAHTHNKTRAFLCSFHQCGKSFNIKSRLTDHMRTVHKSKSKGLDLESAPNDSTVATSVRNGHLRQSVENILDHNFTDRILEFSMNATFNASVSVGCSNDIFVYDIVLPEDQIEKFSKNIGYNSRLRSNLSCTSNINMIGRSITVPRSQTSLHSSSEVEKGHCSYDQNSFLQKTNKERKFMCTWEGCNKKFRDNYNLHVHKCTHTGEMQRSCSLCRYRCVQKSAMDAHMKTHKKLRQKDVKNVKTVELISHECNQ